MYNSVGADLGSVSKYMCFGLKSNIEKVSTLSTRLNYVIICKGQVGCSDMSACKDFIPG